jgi:hypothetical protein
MALMMSASYVSETSVAFFAVVPEHLLDGVLAGRFLIVRVDDVRHRRHVGARY